MGNENNKMDNENMAGSEVVKDNDIELVLENSPEPESKPESKIELVLDSDPIPDEMPHLDQFLEKGPELELEPAPKPEEPADEEPAAEPEVDTVFEPEGEEAAEEPKEEVDKEGLEELLEELEEEPEPEDLGILGGGVEQLEQIQKAIFNLAQTEQEYKETERSLKAKKKELDVQKKRVEEKIASTIKKARTDLEKEFDEGINTAEKAIKEAETQKKNAKALAVNERMKRENSSLVDENKVLDAEIKSKFKEAKVPGICQSSLYYSLFYPKKQTDYLICAVGILIFAGVIPFIVTRFLSTDFLKVLVWILIAVFFAAIYFLISAWTKKGEKNEVLKNMRTHVDQIADNKKFIKNRNKNIKADPDESQYNLYEYDQQIEEARTDLDNAKAEKEQAMLKFENEDSVSMRNEMEAEKAPIFQQLEKEIEQMSEDLDTRSDSYQEALRVMDEYNDAFGEKGLKADKVEEWLTIMKEGRASTIREAMNVQKNK
ncbi:MAG: hypothetical protein IJJ17_07460 [Parasporobacterium sp.]|nr:hypothetical protein [Parasporobacterium sp.]